MAWTKLIVAIGLGLLFAPGQTAYLEEGTTTASFAPALTALGEKVQVVPLGLKANAIERVRGRWAGAADPRSEGIALDTVGHTFAPARTQPLPGRPPE